MAISVARVGRGIRALAPVAIVVLLAACSSGGLDPTIGSFADSIYGEVVDGNFTIPAVQVGGEGGLNPQFARREVPTPEFIPNQPGTIVVDTPHRYLYLVQADGKSMRYGIGVGREGFAWAGTAVIKAKQAWPTWTPPPEMLKRDPSARPYANGMPGGLDNPLGARALYLYVGNEDTLYRLHGTQEAWSIGQAVSSGCVRLLFQDVIDLYNRTPLGTKVIVIGDPDLMKPRPPSAPVADALFPQAQPPVPPGPVGPA